MIERTIKAPDEKHPIAIARHRERVVVFARGKVIADAERALTLREADQPSVLYIPRPDVAMQALPRSRRAPPRSSSTPRRGSGT